MIWYMIIFIDRFCQNCYMLNDCHPQINYNIGVHSITIYTRINSLIFFVNEVEWKIGFLLWNKIYIALHSLGKSSLESLFQFNGLFWNPQHLQKLSFWLTYSLGRCLANQASSHIVHESLLTHQSILDRTYQSTKG